VNREKKAFSAHPVTLRSIVIALFLLPLIYRWHIECEALRYTFPTLMAPFYSVVFAVLIISALNLILRKWMPAQALKNGELLTLYVLMSAAALLMSYDMFLPLVSIVVHAFWHATPENEWRQLFWHYLPDWLTVRDQDTLRAFYLGEQSIFEPLYLLPWLKPIFWWSVFTFALVFVMQCINVIIRKQWVEQEKLAYPIVQLPYEITCNTKNFLLKKMMWWGFILAASISLTNGLHLFFPEIPGVPNKRIPLHHFFTHKPWVALQKDQFDIIVYPFAVGLGFLMPLDLIFSCVFFFFLYKSQYVIGSLIGLSDLPGYPFQYEQNIGAYAGVCVLLLWTTQHQIYSALRLAFGSFNAKNSSPVTVSRDNPNSDENEPMRYRTAFVGIIAGGIFLVAFSIRAGMDLWVATLFFVAHFTIAITLTRIRAEIGFPIHSTTFIGPHHSLVSIFGTRWLGTHNLTNFSLFFWFNRDNRSHPMPHQLEAFKLSQQGNLDSKKLSRSMLFLVVIAMPLCFLMLLDTFLELGVDRGEVGSQINSFGGRAYTFLHSWITVPRPPNAAHLVAIIIGFAVTIFLAIVRKHLFWWPIHPLGYGVSFHMHMFWAAFLISGILKGTILKFGSIRAYRRYVPFFLGLILGDFVIGSAWNILSIILNRPTYTFYY
jgi:hypothetical protein